MKNFFISLFLFCCAFTGFAQERILSYDSHITVEDSGDLLVQEDITVNAEGDQIKRGIYRSFPLLYKTNAGNRFKVGFEVVEVLRNGSPEPYFTEYKDNGVYLYVGDKDAFLDPGIYRYTLKFRTSRQIGFYENYDELYFNAIGGDWRFPIENASVVVELPNRAEVLKAVAFSGAEGETVCACTIEYQDNKVRIETTEALYPSEQLTFAVAWQKGVVLEPSQAQKTWLFLTDNFYLFFAFTGILLVLFLYYRAWKAVGVDPPKGTIIPLYDPPNGLSPAAVSFLHHMALRQRTFTSAIVNMAVKGFIRIRKENKTFVLEETSQNKEFLSKEENAIAEVLFAGRQHLSLDNKNHSILSKATKKAHEILKAKFTPKYFTLNYRHLGKGIVVAVLAVVATFLFAPSPGFPLLMLFLLVGITILFFYLIKAPTRPGRVLMDDIEGFEMYLSVAEQKQLDALHEPDITVERFEKLLPYAIALGVENQWGKKFENTLERSMQEMTNYSPSWYVASGTAFFSPQQFSSTMGSSFSSAISSASAPPGSSSGSSGGGFSGGGGGGGGGGGW